LNNILMLSGGKDSTAMLLMNQEKWGIPITEIVFSDTGMEFPQMYQHLDKLEAQIKRPITRLLAPKTFEYWMFDHVKTKGKHKGKSGYGWANGNANWCTKQMKTWPLTKYLKAKYGTEYRELVGVAFDEYKRLDNDEQKIYPLADMGITEGQCLKYCYDRGYDWGGLYTRFDRVSCWCCPQSNTRELYMLWSFYPTLWERLKQMDLRAWNSFKGNKSVEDFEEQFKKYRRPAKLIFIK
jgi:3'-phosphoadenosine 5'-phosphosulfate sulfotransferase (PAPS reductase)/FAD synthetase